MAATVDHHHHNGVTNGHNKEYNNGYSDSNGVDSLQRLNTVSTINMTPEMFDKLYLSPQNKVKGDLRKTFGNPTPLALVGFLISLTPLSADLMGWRSTGAAASPGNAGIGTYFFFGGLLMLLGALGEWILGNTFPFVVFGSFGAFWLSFGGTLSPVFAASASYSPDPTTPALGASAPAYLDSFGFFTCTMGVLCFVYLICSLRTNIAFVIIFLTLVLAFGCLTGAYFQLALGNLALASKIQKAAGAFTFITCCSGWWIFFAILLASVDFPFQLPVGDLSTVIKAGSKSSAQRNHSDEV